MTAPPIRPTADGTGKSLQWGGVRSDLIRLSAPESPSGRAIHETANRVSPRATGFSDATRAVVIITVITGGLALDQHVAFWGQTLTNAGVWALFLWWLRKTDARRQIGLTACVVYATIGEIFLSLVWGLYDYRLANVPLFVPPGHALLFMLGTIVAARVKDWINWVVPLAASPFVFLLLVSGAGTLDALLFVMFLACMLLGRARRLYAVMFALALAMEIYGTWLGNWTWHTDVPWLGLTAINPPLAAGAFYCVLDLLVMATLAKIRRAGTGGVSPFALALSRQTGGS